MSENVNTNFDDDLEKLDEVNEELNVKKDSDNQNKADEEGLSEEEKKQAEKLRRLREVENRISTDKSKLERDDTEETTETKTKATDDLNSEPKVEGNNRFGFYSNSGNKKPTKDNDSINNNPSGITEMKQTGKEGVINKKFKTIGIFLLFMIVLATGLSYLMKSCSKPEEKKVVEQTEENKNGMQEVDMFKNNASTDTLNNVNVTGQGSSFKDDVNSEISNIYVDKDSRIVRYQRMDDGKVYGIDKDGNIVLDANGNPILQNQEEYNSAEGLEGQPQSDADIAKQEQESLEKLNQMESELLGKRDENTEGLDNATSGGLEEQVKKEKIPNTTPLHEGAGAPITAYKGGMQDRIQYLSAKAQKEEAMQQLKAVNESLVQSKKGGGSSGFGINYKANKVDSAVADIFGTDPTGVQFSAGVGGSNGRAGMKTNTTPYYSYEKEEGKYDIFEGTLIPAVIQNQINSDYKGRVLALVREDVYDSLSGNVLLIPKGSRILGEMLPLNTNGGLERIVTVWDRIILPNGDNIFMENFRGQDLTGIDGIEGKVNKRYFKKIASVVLASVFEGTIGVVSTLPEIMLRKYDTRDGVIYSDSGATAGRRIGDTLTETVNKEVEKVVTRPNTVTLPSGTKTNIVVQIDIKLPKYERVR
jgi:conjugal transfer protein trbI